MLRKRNGYGGIKTDDVDIDTYLVAGVMALTGSGWSATPSTGNGCAIGSRCRSATV